jgi:HlyD family secretion protein
MNLLTRLHIDKGWAFARSHMKISIAAALVLVGAAYGIVRASSGSSQAATYVIGEAQKRTIISTVTGTGQVSALSQVNIQPKASGALTRVAVQNGDHVRAGDLIAQIDPGDAAINLENAQIALDKLYTPADASSITQAQNALASAKESKSSAQDDLTSAYDSGVREVANSFLDMPSIVSGLNDVVYGNGYLSDQNTLYLSDTERSYADQAAASFDTAKRQYDQAFANYKSLPPAAPAEEQEPLIDDAYSAAEQLAKAAKDAKNAVDFIKNREADYKPGDVAGVESNLDTWISKINSHVSSLDAAQKSIQSAKDAITAADRSISDKTAALQKLQQGPDALDVRSQELSVQQRQKALADYSVRAPFDGIVANLDAHKGDTVGSATTLAVLMTQQKVAEISVNEVDVAKLKEGQKATLTFDAVDGLSISGEVAQIDQIGTVTQGVVSYGVKIRFDTQDERIKPGMSVSASIAADVRQDVLAVPASAIKTQNGTSYVEVVDSSTPVTQGFQGSALAAAPSQQAVETGASDDSYTEILSGLNEGDKVVTRTISAASASGATQSQAPSLFGNGGRGGATGGVRIGR